MAKLKIVGWTSFDSEYPTRMITSDELTEQISLIKEEIIKNNYRFSGEEHQNSLTGVPVFSDGTCFRASMRSWGMIMAAIYNGSYMDFYMTLESGSRLPKAMKLRVINTNKGITGKIDSNMIKIEPKRGPKIPISLIVVIIISYKFINI